MDLSSYTEKELVEELKERGWSYRFVAMDAASKKQYHLLDKHTPADEETEDDEAPSANMASSGEGVAVLVLGTHEPDHPECPACSMGIVMEEEERPGVFSCTTCDYERQPGESQPA